MYCRKCGIQIPDDAAACAHCGAPAGGTAPAGTSANLFETGRQHARTILADLQQMDLKKEILPIDGSNARMLRNDFVFWAVTALGIVPLVIVSLQNERDQLTCFALFYAVLWGVIFKNFIIKDQESYRFHFGALFFTGIVGMNLLLAFYQWLVPGFLLKLVENPDPVIRLFGFVFQVGIGEEICKALPVLLYIHWKKDRFNPVSAVLLGAFSGLGFAAFENMSYGQKAILNSFGLTYHYGVRGLVTGVQSAMISSMLRSLSLVFCHAVWAGIFAYFIASALATKKRMGALILIGLLLSATLHGLYDWLCGVQMTLATVVVGFSFVLFYGYVIKIKLAWAPGAD